MRWYLNICPPVFFALLFCFGFFAQSRASSVQNALSMYGEPLLKDDFEHFGFVNPDAPKGGTLTFGVVGTFDGLNPFVIRNFRTTARGLFADQQFGSLVYETMMVRSHDEPFSLYGLLAERVEISEGHTQVTFFLRPHARFADGVSVRVKDVLFSHELLRDHGRPPYSSYMKQVERVEEVAENGVRFYLAPQANRELVLLIAASMPILPRHAIDTEKFTENGLAPILGSGPYLIDKVDAGRRITYRRNPHYWGRDLAVNRGLYNFDEIQIDYYRNDNARFEAFKKGLLDVFVEEQPGRWQLGYDFIGMREGRVVKENFDRGTPAPMVGFVFNTRRLIFKDRLVRRALSMLVDFEWINRNLYHGAYVRTQGFWDGSVLSSLGRAANVRERALLAPWHQLVDGAIMAGEPQFPPGNISGFDREKAAIALDLLHQAGFKRRGNRLHAPDGQAFGFELLISRSDDEKLALAYARSLARIGIDMTVRHVDDSQYQNRLGSFDYDMIVGRLSASLSPGTEQLNRWSSSAATMRGSFNFAGVAEIAVDRLLAEMVDARDWPEFVDSVRALDRLLISGHYYIPLYHLPQQFVARWSHVHPPSRPALYGYRLPAWWYEPTK